MNSDTTRPTLLGLSGWWKSSYSAGANGCVEVNDSVTGYVGVRDSKLGDNSPVLVFEPHEIRAFVLGAKNGEFDHLLT
ncbi:DUF397 domain-containing protein [Amycolatopsis azurea]|uniref:DUF397 domain-containing protein n=1 Tax=Amycolatopsis azurea DSM 43854 TaxID=1238180 RepID=M2PVX7_9PSEU|nr:DUF397 domain-containing protein [Amycolatopsis azurea]EMD23760.1 hypothetical protein C791_6747 [Amycolatopsis azurea DSM 43854]OOC02474.1 DUF397 domain-containing protein [Amycolatopsis azurea DSM 43854]